MGCVERAVRQLRRRTAHAALPEFLMPQPPPKKSDNEKSAREGAGPNALSEREAAERLIRLGGSDSDASVPARRRDD